MEIGYLKVECGVPLRVVFGFAHNQQATIKPVNAIARAQFARFHPTTITDMERMIQRSLDRFFLALRIGQSYINNLLIFVVDDLQNWFERGFATGFIPRHNKITNLDGFYALGAI